MTSYVLILPLAISLATVLFLMPWWIRKVKFIGLVWDDMNKSKSEKIAGSGGLIVLLAFILGVLTYISYRVFLLGVKNGNLVEIFAILVCVIFMGFIGFMDDLLGWRRGGLSIKSRVLLVIFGAVPLIAINAGKSTMVFPFFGAIDIGLIYPLFLIPIGFLATTTTFNILAGFNGLEAGQGIILLSGLGMVAYLTSNPWLSVICFCMVLALIGFLKYNWVPAKVFPGDVITYSIGALIAAVTIVGNFEKIAFFFYIPYILEVILKSRGRLKKSSFGKINNEGCLDNQYSKIYSLNHLAIWLLKKVNIKSTEKNAVLTILAFQFVVIVLGFYLFRASLF